jgi:dTDP-4-dehydrorhamnose 3,5-epimerase-like enzyme
MIFEDTRIGGVWIIRPERLEDDDRGFFAQTWDEEFAERGLARAWSSAGSRSTGVAARCAACSTRPRLTRRASSTAGAIYDVAVD